MPALAPTGRGGEEDHGRSLPDGRVEPVERPDVLSLDVDVDERRDLVVLHELVPEHREARQQVVEQLADVAALGGNLAHAADVAAQHRWDPDPAHACAGLPEQKSTYSMYSVIVGESPQ